MDALDCLDCLTPSRIVKKDMPLPLVDSPLSAAVSRREAIQYTLAGMIAATVGLPRSATAQSYPTRAVRLLVPVAAGGGTDMIARVVADALSRHMGQPWVVDNQAGAGGQIASQAIARAEPDGYNLLLGYVSTHGTLPAVRKLPYDVLKDFTPITMIGGAPNVLVCNAATGPKSFQDYLADLRANPGQAGYGSAGTGTITHLVYEHLKLATRTSVLHIPYRGIAPALTDLMAGQVQYSMPGLAGALGYIKSGKLRPLVVTGPARHPQLPEVPTLEELGVKNFKAAQWVGIMGPAHMPAAVVMALESACAQVLRKPELTAKLAGEGLQMMPMSQPEFTSYVAADLARWRSVVKEQGIKES